MCFHKAIGNHLEGSGLVEAWIESGLFKPNGTEHDMNEKAYKRALRAHRITLQSLRQLLMLISFKKDLSSLLSRKCWSTDNIPEVTKSEKDAR